MSHFFIVTLPIMFLGITSIIQTFWIARLSDRIREIQNAMFLKDWIKALEDGESLSDIAYMKEKGFLK
jgi:hypothetical protein